jgi:peptidyl-prolyl cis-trans isomerase B (cyclophilin B)
MKKMIVTLLAAAICCVPMVAAAEDPPRVRLETTLGSLVIELDPQRAPQTVDNFLRYARDGFYHGTIFHRVIKGFMIQGGGLTVDMQKKNTRDPVENEADNGLKNDRGTVAMARTNAPHSATAQFFINTVSNDFLNHRAKTQAGWGYCVFGKVVEGMSVVDQIENLATTSVAGRRDVPKEPVIIHKAVILNGP